MDPPLSVIIIKKKSVFIFFVQKKIVPNTIPAPLQSYKGGKWQADGEKLCRHGRLGL